MSKPLGKIIGESLADSICYVAYGSPSYRTWKKAADDSLKRSQRRRELNEDSGWTVGMWLLLVMFVFAAALIAVGLLLGRI